MGSQTRDDFRNTIRSDGTAIDFREAIAAPLIQLAGRTIDTTTSAIGAFIGSNHAIDRFEQELDSLFKHKTLQDMPRDPIFAFYRDDLQTGSLFLMSKSFRVRPTSYAATGWAQAKQVSAAEAPGRRLLVHRGISLPRCNRLPTSGEPHRSTDQACDAFEPFSQEMPTFARHSTKAVQIASASESRWSMSLNISGFAA